MLDFHPPGAQGSLRRIFLLTTAMLWLLCSATIAMGQKTQIHTSPEPLSPTTAAATMRVPEGFRVTLYAGEPDVMQPIGFCIDDRNRLWVAEAYNYPHHGTRPGDRIVILEDTDGDGTHDRRTVFFEGLNYVSGIEVGFGGAWVMSPPNMYFIPDRNGDDVPDESPQLLLDGFGNHANAHNMANGFAWGPDGWLYATHGRTNWSMIGKPGDAPEQRRRFDGGVWRYHPVDHVWEPVADGTTNPWGIDWNDYGDAFICNCVNPHLFQVIPGAHYEPWRGRKSSEYAYRRIDTIADHLHFVGLGNVRNGLGSDEEDNAGGGHAHCGTMIYLGDAFPEQYRNQLFTNNIHGRRINHDLLRMHRSGYLASHGPDLMRSEDPWFMGVTLAYGAAGEVYVSDWSDTGECHSTKNTRRHTGRIFRITFGSNAIKSVDLKQKNNAELVELQLHDNDWYVRHSRRLLQERSVAGAPMESVHQKLRELLMRPDASPKRLRALWALKVTEGINEELLLDLLNDKSIHLQQWAIRLACEDRNPGAQFLTLMHQLALTSTTARVRLELACALQRLPLNDRWPIAEALIKHMEDHDDPNIPCMLWYGIEPLVHDNIERFANLAASSSIPLIREHVARRILAAPNRDQGLELTCELLASDLPVQARHNLLDGMLLGLEGQRSAPMPSNWTSAYHQITHSRDPYSQQQAIQLALLFQDQSALQTLRKIANDSNEPADFRQIAIQALVNSGVEDFDRDLRFLLDDDSVRAAALRGLAQYASPQIAETIVSRYPTFSQAEKQVALATLATRVDSARALLNAIAMGDVPASDLTAFTARQIRSHDDAALLRQLGQLWGEVRESPQARRKKIEALAKTMSPEILADANLDVGKKLFMKHCGTCHRFFGDGGFVGPDITGAQRDNVRYLLENMIDPSASVAKAFRMQIVRTEDGRVFTGMIESKNELSMTIVNATERQVLPLEEVLEIKESEVSVMPAGLLDPLSERQIRDLIGYLQK